MEPVLRVGISACLLGEKVRWDGGDKKNALLLETLGRRVEWVPVCPEIAIGLGVPRESVRLVKTARGVRMIASESGRDHTQTMKRWARAHVEELARLRLHGFVLKSASPSCGLSGVKLHRARGAPLPEGRGLFAEAVVARLADLPVEEEANLGDAAACRRFLARIAAYARAADDAPATRVSASSAGSRRTGRRRPRRAT